MESTVETEKVINIPPDIEKELGPENIKNLEIITANLKKTLKDQNYDGNLLLVGGTVRPEKKGKDHKDVDLRLRSKALAVESFSKTGPKFDRFAEFMSQMCKKLNWEIEIQQPVFYSYPDRKDGIVVLTPQKGKPIEILPAAEGALYGSFEEFKKHETDPYFVLF